MPPRSASVPTLTASGTDPSPAALEGWRRRLSKQIEVTRDLPWRETRDPWAVLVAEVMLQQTQVTRVIPAWTEFLTAMPRPADCAAAGRAEVVRRWAGLGYNRRAVALHSAAVTIVEVHDGVIPRGLDDLLALPGVGPYTARAVLAFAFEEDVAVVDTNVARIVARAVIGQPLGAAALQRVADTLVPAGKGWGHNQAMLDLGAVTCTAIAPSCSTCPIRRSCAWRQDGCPDPDPARSTAGTARPQARFEGSDRQARGALLDLLRGGPASGGSLDALATSLGRDRFDRSREGLMKDGLIEVDGDGLRLRGS